MRPTKAGLIVLGGTYVAGILLAFVFVSTGFRPDLDFIAWITSDYSYAKLVYVGGFAMHLIGWGMFFQLFVIKTMKHDYLRDTLGLFAFKIGLLLCIYGGLALKHIQRHGAG